MYILFPSLCLLFWCSLFCIIPASTISKDSPVPQIPFFLYKAEIKTVRIFLQRSCSPADSRSASVRLKYKSPAECCTVSDGKEKRRFCSASFSLCIMIYSSFFSDKAWQLKLPYSPAQFSRGGTDIRLEPQLFIKLKEQRRVPAHVIEDRLHPYRKFILDRPGFLTVDTKDNRVDGRSFVELDLAAHIFQSAVLQLQPGVQDACEDKAFQNPCPLQSGPFGLMIAAGVAGQVGREFDRSALLAFSGVDHAFLQPVPEFLNNMLPVPEILCPDFDLFCTHYRPSLIIRFQNNGAHVLCSAESTQEGMLRQLFDLTVSGVSAHLRYSLKDIRHSGSTECMSVRGTAAIGVHGLVAVIGKSAVQHIFPAFTLGQVTDFLGCKKCGRSDKVIDKKQIDIIARKSGQLINLARRLGRCLLFQVRYNRIQNRCAAAQDLNRLGIELLGNLGRHYDAGRRSVRHAGIAGGAQILGHLRVEGGLHVFPDIIIPCFLRHLIIGFSADRALTESCVSPEMISLVVQHIVDLICAQAVFMGIVVDPVIMIHAGTAAQISAVSTVKNGIQIREQDFCGQRDTIHGGSVAIRHAGTLVTASGQYDVISTAGYRKHCFFQCNITGTAAFRVGQGAFASHSEPVRHLQVGRDAVVHNMRIGTTVEEELYVSGLNTCVRHRVKRRISEEFPVGQSLIGRVLNTVEERGCADSDDGDASHIPAEFHIGQHDSLLFTFIRSASAFPPQRILCISSFLCAFLHLVHDVVHDIADGLEIADSGNRDHDVVLILDGGAQRDALHGLHAQLFRYVRVFVDLFFRLLIGHRRKLYNIGQNFVSLFHDFLLSGFRSFPLLFFPAPVLIRPDCSSPTAVYHLPAEPASARILHTLLSGRFLRLPGRLQSGPASPSRLLPAWARRFPGSSRLL